MSAPDVEIIDRLARIEVKLDSVASDNVRGDAIHNDHEIRLRRLEKWMYASIAVSAAGGTAAGQIIAKAIGG